MRSESAATTTSITAAKYQQRARAGNTELRKQHARRQQFDNGDRGLVGWKERRDIAELMPGKRSGDGEDRQ
jgi:hypothetical protein